MTGRDVVIIVLCVLACVFVLYRVGHALEVRHYPPLSCQILGGHWDFWNGWRCG